MPAFHFGPSFALAAILTVAAAAQEVPAVAPQPAAKPIPGAKVITLDRFVPSGSEQKLQFIVSVDPDCTPQTQPTTRIIAKPRHGTLQIADAEDYAYWTPPNVREKCNDKKLKGLKVSYKSDDDYTGEDGSSLLVIFPDSSATQFIFNIKVW